MGKITKIQALNGRFSTNARLKTGVLGTLDPRYMYLGPIKIPTVFWTMIKKYSYGADWFQKGGCTTVLEYRHQLHIFTYIYFQAGEEDPKKRMFFLATLWRILHVSIVLLWGPGEAQSGYSNTILDLVFLGEAQWKKTTPYNNIRDICIQIWCVRNAPPPLLELFWKFICFC